MHPALLLPLLLFLVACSDQAQTLSIEAQLAELRARPQGQVEALPEFPEPKKAKYQQQDRDPFLPSKIATKGSNLAGPDLQRQPGILEQWDLSQLSFRGSMQRGNITRALIITPENQLVSVVKGDHLGKDHGTIIHLDTHSITLRELVSTGSGWQEREQTIYISR